MFKSSRPARRDLAKASCVCLVVLALAGRFTSPTPRAFAQTDTAYSVGSEAAARR